MLATVRPRDIAGKTRRGMAAEEITDLVAVEKKLKKINAELKAAVRARGSTLMDIHGVGPASPKKATTVRATIPSRKNGPVSDM
jgi:transposase